MATEQEIRDVKDLAKAFKGAELHAVCKNAVCNLSPEEIDAIVLKPVVTKAKKKKSKSGEKIQKDALAQLVRIISRLRKVENMTASVAISDEVTVIRQELQLFIKEKV